MPISEVYNEDNMIGMARFPDKFFDLAIVDPPYGINATNMAHWYGEGVKDGQNKKDNRRKQKGRNTSYGHKKIKANDPACPLFKKVEQ